MYQSPEHGGAAVYSAPEATQDKPAHRALSVKTQSIIGATLIILLFLAVSAVNLTLAKAYYQPQGDNGLSTRLQAKAQLIESRLAYLRQLIERVARQPTTQDLLSTGDNARAQRWALQMQRFFPQALGVAVIDNNANVLGEPPNHQIGPFCLTDLAQLSQGAKIKAPPVHPQAQPAPHFDLSAPVFDDAENRLGLLFVSFALDGLQDLLRTNNPAGQQFVLRDGHGNIFVQSGELAADATPHSARWPLHKTDWQLELTEPAVSATTPSFISLLIFNISAFLLIVGSIALLVRRHTHRVEGDFLQVREHIEDLAHGRTDAETPKPGLGEAAHILPALSSIRQNLSAQQQKLAQQNRTDAPTGLANRRQFNLEFSRAYDFARRNMPVCVVLSRLEGLDKLAEKAAYRSVKLLARALLRSSRKVDLAARLGEDQFGLLLFNTKRDGIEPCLQRLQDSFHSQQLKHADIPDDKACSLRCGYTLIHRHRDNDAGQVLARAEQALGDADEERPVIGR